MDVKHRHDGLWHKNGKFDNTQAHCYYEGNEEHYAHYEDFDAINVESTDEIPIDYDGVMGVPISWFYKYNPNEFEILEMHEPCVNIETVRRLQWKEYKSRQKMYNGKLCQKRYHRMFIRNQKPDKKSRRQGLLRKKSRIMAIACGFRDFMLENRSLRAKGVHENG